MAVLRAETFGRATYATAGYVCIKYMIKTPQKVDASLISDSKSHTAIVPAYNAAVEVGYLPGKIRKPWRRSPVEVSVKAFPCWCLVSFLLVVRACPYGFVACRPRKARVSVGMCGT